MFNIHDPILRLGLSHWNEHRYNHKFKHCVNPKCICSSENESTSQFFLHCHTLIRNTLFDKLKEIATNLQELSDQNITEILLHGSPHFTDIQNCINFKFCHELHYRFQKIYWLSIFAWNCFFILRMQPRPFHYLYSSLNFSLISLLQFWKDLQSNIFYHHQSNFKFAIST